MKFSIRDLMLVTIIVAVCTAWCLEKTKLKEEISKLKKSLEGRVVYTTYPPAHLGGRNDGIPIGDY